jgi:hypothetical protein
MATMITNTDLMMKMTNKIILEITGCGEEHSIMVFTTHPLGYVRTIFTIVSNQSWWSGFQTRNPITPEQTSRFKFILKLMRETDDWSWLKEKDIPLIHSVFQIIFATPEDKLREMANGMLETYEKAQSDGKMDEGVYLLLCKDVKEFYETIPKMLKFFSAHKWLYDTETIGMKTLIMKTSDGESPVLVLYDSEKTPKKKLEEVTGVLALTSVLYE